MLNSAHCMHENSMALTFTWNILISILINPKRTYRVETREHRHVQETA